MHTMNAEGYVLPPTSRLRYICIAQIGLGVLAMISNMLQQGPSYRGWSTFQFACAALLLFTGGHGFRAIRRLKMNILDSQSFRILSACNAVLCAIYCISMLVLLWTVTQLKKLPIRTVSHGLAGISSNTTVGDRDQGEIAEDLRKMQEEMYYVELSRLNNALITGCIIAIVLTGVFIACTAMAANMSFRLSASILTAGQQPVMIPPAGVPMMGGPGYGTYQADPIEPLPTFTPYLPVKQDFQ